MADAITRVIGRAPNESLVLRLLEEAKELGGDVPSLVEFVETYRGRDFRWPRVFLRLIAENLAGFLKTRAPNPKPTRKLPDPKCPDCRGVGFVMFPLWVTKFAFPCACSTSEPEIAESRRKHVAAYRVIQANEDHWLDWEWEKASLKNERIDIPLGGGASEREADGDQSLGEIVAGMERSGALLAEPPTPATGGAATVPRKPHVSGF